MTGKKTGEKPNGSSKDKSPTSNGGPMNIDKELRTIYVDALASGMSEEKIRRCFLSEVYGQARLQKYTSLRVLGAVLLPVVLAVVFRGTIRAELSDMFHPSSMCSVDNNMYLIEIARPLNNCSAMCRGLENGVPVVENITAEDFLLNFVRPARPLLVTGVAKHWPALDVFSYDYFKNLYMSHENAVEINEEECQFFTYGSNITTMSELFNMSEKRARLEGDPWYIGWSNCEERVKKTLRQSYEHPQFIPFATSDHDNLDWIFMGASGPGAIIHLDNVGKPSWQAQIKGSKTWSLLPTAECESECPARLDVRLEKGDIIFVDTNKWFHSTKVHTGDMSITIGSEYSDDLKLGSEYSDDL